MALETKRQTIEVEALIGAQYSQVLIRAEALVPGAGREAIEPMMAEANVSVTGADVQTDRVVLDGISMDGATVLMAAGLDLPPNVVGVIADCPFTSPRDIFEHVMRTSIKLPTWLLWGADLCCRLMAGFSIDGARTGQRRQRQPQRAE